jgi:hypothetical protein
MNVLILESAIEDLVEAIEYFNRQSEGLGLRFRHCVEKTLEGVINFPKASAVIRKGYRVRPVKRFRKYGILYRVK